MAGGVFAPGHLGELTQIVPFEMVDEVLAETGGMQRRTRKLPSRVVVYLLLAAGLFENVGYLGVWRKLVAGLKGVAVAAPSATALWHARARVGAAPLKALFELLRGPACSVRTTGTWWRGLLVTAFDGTTMTVPEAPGTAALGKHGGSHGPAGYPQIRVLALVACGTRAMVDAVFGPMRGSSEPGYARELFRSCHPGMIVLLDRGFDGNAFLAALADTGTEFLARLSSRRKPPILQRYPDGSFLSVLGGQQVRIVCYQITVTTTAGTRTATLRLASTLLDHRTHPAAELASLYHERWEIESAYLELKSTMLGGRVLRSTTPQGITQEVYALLCVYQILRQTIAEATDTVPGADPDRASFTVALETAREQLINAAAVIADTMIDLVGTIGHQVLANLMPPRRTRISPRAVKRPLSRYAHQSLRINRKTYKATLNINIHHTT